MGVGGMKGKAAKRPTFARAVPDLSLARSPGEYKLSVSLDRQWVIHRVAAWSVGLRWVTFDFGNVVHRPKSRLFVAQLDDEYLAKYEHRSFEKWMQWGQDPHMRTHAVALGLDLAPGGHNDLPHERMMIDRLQKEMLDGVDLHGPAAAMATDGDYLQFLANNLEYREHYVGDHHFQLTQTGTSLPVLSAFLRIGRATYSGNALDLDDVLPEVVCTGVIGRQLKELVSTGLPELDARVITQVHPSRDEIVGFRPMDSRTRLQLTPNLVELGP